MIYLLTGQPGSGKTTLAQQMLAAGLVDSIVDGDELRALGNPGYGRDGRVQNIDRAHSIARFLEARGERVAVAVVQPYAFQRDAMKARGAAEIHMAEHWGVRAEYAVEDYEPPENPDLVSPTVEEVLFWTKRPRALFIGRFQTFHDGHRWLFRQALDQGKPLAIAVRDTGEEKPAQQIVREIKAEFPGAEVFTIPNIGSVEYGRSVGYDVIEHVPPDDIGAVSGTALRAAATEAVN